MGEVLQAWLRDRLGLIVDLKPDNFGLTTKDGTLLAQLLHSYDIIDNAQLKTIIVTEDPALARVNLKHLRIWLKFIGVDCDDDTIEDISNGRGSTAARLFYKIFVNLESKDKLHFITQQKEREKFIPNSSKFDVTTISDMPTTPEPSENPLAAQLIQNASVIAWHRHKFQAILDRCKLARAKCVAIQERRTSVHRELKENFEKEKLEVRADRVSSVEKAIQDIQDFSEKHRVRSPEQYTYDELYNEKKYGEQIQPVPVDPKAAKTYVKSMKHRTEQATAIFNCKNRMERELTAKLWDKQKQEQETKFDRAIAKKLFSQSCYEKRMMTKLCEIRDQKQRIARNRGLVDKLMQERMRTERNMELASEHEVIVKEGEDIQAECLRLCDLHRRIYEEKVLNIQKKHYRMCSMVLNDLIDISLTAVDYRQNNDNFIPAKMWSEWKALFMKSQPIFATVEHIENIAESRSKENAEEIFRAEIERQSILNDADFDNYLNVGSPWNEFLPEIDLDTQEILRLGIIVLGYIVHQLLEYMYPFGPNPEPAGVPKVSSACILLGVLDRSVYPIIQTLLNHRGVKLLQMEDAINYCLLCYKQEMKEFAYIDLNALSSKKEVQPKNTGGDAGSRGKKNTAVKKHETLNKTPKATIPTTRGIDEATQTPRVIPNDDMSPDLSNSAYIGQWVHEYLTLGQPISDELNTKILIEYMKSLTDAEGWVLVDYPNTFDQMARLETALTGLKIPLGKTKSDDFDDDAEEMSPTFSRISYEAQNEEEFSVFRESRLVTNPIQKRVERNSKSYMTAYIRALPKPKNMNVEETDIHEILPEDTNAMDAFYTEQGLAYAVYYTSFNMFTLKRLCRLAIGDMSIPRIPSEELFGDSLNLLEDKKDQPPPSKAPIVKQLMPRPDPSNIDWGGESEYETEGYDALENVLDALNNVSIPPKPGEDGWKWIKLPQAPMLLEALATLWESMETVYIEDLKEIFFMKRVQFSNIVPYRNHVAKHMNEFIDRPDMKQDMLHAFHRSYNDIDKDMREDLDVRCELHCRVEDFRKELWEICDDRRKEAVDERQRIISQDWTAEEMVVLANLYISIIKAEIDRCVDTVQLIQDYYTSMLQRPINTTRLSKYPLHRLELNANELAASASTLSPAKSSKAPTKIAPSAKTGKNMTSRDPQAAPRIDCSLIKKQIADLLISADKELFDPGEMTCYHAVHMNIMYVQNVVDSLAASVLEALKQEQAAFTPDGKGRVQIPKAQLLPTANAELLADILNQGSDLCQEWGSALQYEIARMRMRLKLLDNAALSDISFLYETMENCFRTILERTNDRYNREIKSVNDMASVFCFAIEEGVPIQEELLLDGDRFIVKSNVLMFPDDPTPPPEPIREAILPSQFRMGQLGRLMDVFRYVAPHGSLPERCLTYILEDMVTYREEEGGMAHLPSTWSELRGSDVSDLVAEIFGDSEYIDWREFIIYAMDIPMPSDEEILDARSQFLAMDPNLTEMVTRDQFHSVTFWFSNSDFKDPCCEKLLHEDCQEDEEEVCEVEGKYRSKTEEINGSVSSINTPPESDPSFISKKSYTNSTFSSNSRNMTPQETVRLMLAKELLCEMFAFRCNTVNYTAFLLAFSKDYDPRVGFGKALTLVLGEKVCTSEDEGEKFVAKLLEQQRLAAAEENLRNCDREAAEKKTSSVMTEDTLEPMEGITDSEIDDLHHYDDRTQTMVSEQERPVRIENLDTGWPSISEPSKPDMRPSFSFAPPGSKESDSYEMNQKISTGTILAEGYSKESLGMIGEAVIVHWIPRDVCQSVLVASLPWHARQPDILGTTCCLRECLEKVYADIIERTISDEHDYVLSHRLVNHEFIVNLLNSTTAFTMKHIGNIMHNLLNKRSDLKQTANC